MKVLLTGGNGFLGKIISYQFKDNFALTTIGRSSDNDIICDLAGTIPELEEYQYIIHAAGKAHSTSRNKREAQEFLDVNYRGTVNLTDALDNSSVLPEALVFISTVAVYGVEQGEDVDESHPLNGSTPYAKSKIQAEQHLIEWGIEKGVKIGVLRLPLIVGKNPPGNLGAMIHGIRSGKYLRIGKGQSRKSMVLATDIANIIPQIFKNGGIYNLTDGYHPNFLELETVIAAKYDKNLSSIPRRLAYILALPGSVFDFWPINSSQIEKITSNLTFCDKKAQEVLNWKPTEVLKELSKIL